MYMKLANWRSPQCNRRFKQLILGEAGRDETPPSSLGLADVGDTPLAENSQPLEDEEEQEEEEEDEEEEEQ
jgi:hypothetical protein